MSARSLSDQLAEQRYITQGVQRILAQLQATSDPVPPSTARTQNFTDATPEQPQFFLMPREIRDEIYNLAFNQDRRMFKVTSLAYLMQRIREERRRYQLRVPHSMSNSTTRTIAARMTPDTVPGCPLERMLVCKQFFDEAASAWLRSHTIICGDNLESIEAFMRSSAVRAHLTGLAYRAGGNFLIPEISPVFKHLSNLRTFSLLIGDYCFDDVKCRLCWFHDLQPRDFEQVTFPVEILNIETLEKIKLEPKVSELAITQQEQNK